MDDQKITTFKQMALQQGFSPDEVDSFVSSQSQMPRQESFGYSSGLNSPVPVTQGFGQRSSVEKYSGGVNLGTDFATPSGTPLSAPPGEWQVIEAQPGFNDGSGNFVKLKNTKTGETVGYEHLSQIGVQPGQMINGGVVGLSGGNQQNSGRGNSTGAHASIPYTDSSGRYRDILSTPYAQTILGK